MFRRLVAGLLICALGACATDDPLLTPSNTTASGKPGGSSGSSEISVTTTIAGVPNDATYQLGSDGLGSYINGSNLISVVQGIGDWVLDLRGRGVARTVFLDFSRPIAGTGPGGGNPIAVPSGAYSARLIAKCSSRGRTIQSIQPGETILCPLNIAFSHDGTDYAVQMNPDGVTTDGPAGTDLVNVTCTSPEAGSGPCVVWRMTPTRDGGNIAKLLKVTTCKGKSVRTSQGNFLYAFDVAFTNP